MKKSKFSATLSICREKTDKKSRISVSLKTSTGTKSNLQTQRIPRISLIVKQLISFALTNYEKFLMFYPFIKTSICVDLFIFLFVENFLK